jgi:hypothetical protein
MHDSSDAGVLAAAERQPIILPFRRPMQRRPEALRRSHADPTHQRHQLLEHDELAPPVSARFDVRLAQHDSRATIGDVVELELTKMRNPVTHAEAHPEVLLPEGLVVKRGGLAASGVFRVKDELALDHSGQYAAFGRFQYS